MAENHLLISFCNLPVPKKEPLILLKLSHEGIYTHIQNPISIGYPQKVKSATGVTRNNDWIFVLFSHGNRTYIASLNPANLMLNHYQELKEVKDPHSILIIDSEFFIVSTGTDEIIHYEFSKNHELVKPKVYWKASDAQCDTHHINSIICHNQDVIVSAFGLKKGKGWPSAQNGYIYNVSKRELLKDGIYHPHTLSSRRDKIYYCESKKSEFHQLGQDEFIGKFDGYTRGVAWITDDLVCIANSNRGKNTRWRRILTRLTKKDFIQGSSSLSILDVMRRELVCVVDLSSNGPEVYDVIILGE